MNSGVVIEEIFYWSEQLQAHQQVIYWAMWALVPSFLMSVLNIYTNKQKTYLEEVWFISTLLNLIVVFVISLSTPSWLWLLSIFIILELAFLLLISHLINYEK